MTIVADIPLFVLPMTLVPGEVTSLRVFEPRYKQMLDTCILDDRPFGLILSDPFRPVKGWDGPRNVGTLAYIEEHHEVGSNHMIAIRGGERFEVVAVHEPALPPFGDPAVEDLLSDEGVIPPLEVLLQRAEALGRSDLPLYLSADVRLMPTPEPDEEEVERLEAMMRDGLIDLAEAMGVDVEAAQPWVDARIEALLGSDAHAILLASSLVLPDADARQQVLEAVSCEGMLEELERGLLEVREAFRQDQT
jgi:Lon protease-like protein